MSEGVSDYGTALNAVIAANVSVGLRGGMAASAADTSAGVADYAALARNLDDFLAALQNLNVDPTHMRQLQRVQAATQGLMDLAKRRSEASELSDRGQQKGFAKAVSEWAAATGSLASRLGLALS